MTLIHAILLSVIEGITEFLPVSSTGHLILASNILGITQTEFTKSFELFIQLGAILAVIWLHWRKFFVEKKLIVNIGISFLPTAGAGFLLYPVIKHSLLGNSQVVSWSLILGGLVLIAIERVLLQKRANSQTNGVSYKQAFLIGCAQAISFVPGVSRAGATIAGALLLGVSRETAVEYSFLLAIPTMAAAVGLDLVKTGFRFSISDLTLLSVGFFGAFVTALFAVRVFTTYVKTHSFIPFGIYRIAIGTLFLLS